MMESSVGSPYPSGMEAKILRGTPPTTPDGRPVWQLETRPDERTKWDAKFGAGYISSKAQDLREFVKENGWKLIEDGSRNRGSPS